MLDTVLRVVGQVVRFQRHTVIAHAVGSMFAKSSVVAGDLAVLIAPVLVDCVLFYSFPWSGARSVRF